MVGEKKGCVEGLGMLACWTWDYACVVGAVGGLRCDCSGKKGGIVVGNGRVYKD